MQHQKKPEKETLLELLEEAIAECRSQGSLTETDMPKILLEVPKHRGQGDFATTLALSLAKIEKNAPRKIADVLVSKLQNRVSWIKKIEIAGPGYINFFLTDDYWRQTLFKIHDQKSAYGKSSASEKKKIQIEFVSANPTGPLHVAHGRAAALGDALARLLEAVGHEVNREYYLNDIGGQMDLLGRSTYLRYRGLFGENISMPEGSYMGGYIIQIAEDLKRSDGDRYLHGPESAHLPFFTKYSFETIVSWIKRDLNRFRIDFDRWFSEKTLHENKEVLTALEYLASKELLYKKNGADWVATMRFGDDKDRVVVRSNGQKTYFASDIAYHRNKFSRGYDLLINIWGADHHGYIRRIKAAAEAMGYDSDRLSILTHQLVNLMRDGKPVRMSKRTGTFVTLREVMDEVGVDATRFFFLMRRSDSALDFDLELAKKSTNENPVFYVQYAHARLCSIVRVAKGQGWDLDDVIQNADRQLLERLDQAGELAIIRQLSLYPDLIKSAAVAMEPHRITFYLQTLAGSLHRYYFGCRVITEDRQLTKARLVLITAIRIVILNGLDILGIRAPEEM